MNALTPSDRAPGLLLGPDVELPDDIGLGGHVIIHAGVVIEPGCQIQDGAVIGKLPVLGPRSRSPVPEPGARTLLERGALIGAHAVIVAGARLGAGSVVGDHTLIRELVRLEAGAVVGSGSGIGRGTRIGAGSKLISGALLATDTVIEADVFCGPRLIVTNDAAMGRQPAGVVHPVTTLRRGCRIAANVTLLPRIEIGEEAVVGAGSVVTRDVAARTVVVGSPARKVRDVRDDELLDDPGG